MPEATQLMQAIEKGDPHAASQLLPLVYDELRRLAIISARQGKLEDARTYHAEAIKDPAHFWGTPYHYAEYQLLRHELERLLRVEPSAVPAKTR